MKTYKTKSGKIYTKKQICEAISFWKQQLKQMNEDRRRGLDVTYIDADDVINNPDEFPLKICVYDVLHDDPFIYLAGTKNPRVIRTIIVQALEDFYNCDDWYGQLEYTHPKTGTLTQRIDNATIEYLCNQLRRKGVATLNVFNDEYGKMPLQLTFATDAVMRKAARNRDEFIIVD